MLNSTKTAENQYDAAAPKWGDKMRALGYYDGYVGFLSAQSRHVDENIHVIDVGSGTASFAEAWTTVHGAPKELTLIDPSAGMLERGYAAMKRREIEPRLVKAALGEMNLEPADEVLAAHVIEHCEDPHIALRQMYELLLTDGRLHLVVSKPHWCNALIWLQWRHRTFSEKEILHLVQKAGFEVENVYAFPSGPPSRTSRGIVAIRKD